MLISLDNKVLTGNTIQMKRARVGHEVALHKLHTKEVFQGTIVKLLKPNQYMLYINVETYFKDGTHRPRWKTKVKGFRNSSKIRIHLISDPAQMRDQQAQARKAYSQHRRLLSNKRDEASDLIELLQSQIGDNLNVQVHFRMDDVDMKKLYRAVAIKFHPDKLQQSTISQQEFGSKMMDALAHFRNMRAKVVR